MTPRLLHHLRAAADVAGAEAPPGDTWGDVLDLLDRLTAAVEREQAAVAPPVRSRAERTIEWVRELAERGLRDPEIAELTQLGSPNAVRKLRERHGIAGQDPRPRPNGWQDRIRAAHERGLTDAEIAVETDRTVGAVRKQRAALGLPANRRSGG